LLSSAVSWFDPVPIEIAACLCAVGGRELPQTFGLSVGKTVDPGARIFQAPLSAFTCNPKIDQFSHFVSRR
jgi:hypothetical protein